MITYKQFIAQKKLELSPSDFKGWLENEKQLAFRAYLNNKKSQPTVSRPTITCPKCGHQNKV